jgi:hypothetical protein
MTSDDAVYAKLQVFQREQRHIQEAAGAARWVKHAERAQPIHEGLIKVLCHGEQGGWPPLPSYPPPSGHLREAIGCGRIGRNDARAYAQAG